MGRMKQPEQCWHALGRMGVFVAATRSASRIVGIDVESIQPRRTAICIGYGARCTLQIGPRQKPGSGVEPATPDETGLATGGTEAGPRPGRELSRVSRSWGMGVLHLDQALVHRSQRHPYRPRRAFY